MAATDPEFRFRLNQARFRTFRDRAQVAFLCECSQADCHRSVILSPSEYEALRPGPILHGSHPVGEPPVTA